MHEKHYAGIDYFRLIAALLIVSIHTSPLGSVDPEADFILTRILARVAVPFFLMATGFFLLPRYMEDKKMRKTVLMGFLKKTSLLYGMAILIYLPVDVYAGALIHPIIIWELFKDIFFNGTFYHLWYLPASIIGMAAVCLLIDRFKRKTVCLITIGLYLIALFGDSYYGISERVGAIGSFYAILFNCFDYTRNGLLMAPVFIFTGGMIAASKRQWSVGICTAGLLLSTALMISEGLLLKGLSVQRHDSMYIMLLPCMFFLFQLLLKWKGKNKAILRKLSMMIFIIHPMCIILVRGIAKGANLTWLLVDNSMVHFIVVAASSLAGSFLFILMTGRRKDHFKKDRAWAEINLANLSSNVDQLKKILPKGCDIMAVVKANAYGHGDTEIARELNKLGVFAFAVATVSEGVKLRRKGICGEILILGYTFPDEISGLIRYDLTQTVLDHSYAGVLNDYGEKIKVHVKIDTGMHRLGENYSETQNLLNIYSYRNLIINGTFTHLSVSDSLADSDVEFTNHQIEKFYDTVKQLKEAGCKPGKIHIQSSYGVLNYPYLKCDYARIGIALYGAMSNENDKTRVNIDLKPVLSLKARVVITRRIPQSESAGYGRQFVAEKDSRIAVISVGYADGIPRNLSGGNGHVLINGQKAPIIGKICMDQLMVDISYISTVKQGDIATLIGSDGSEYIPVEALAAQSATLTNELLSRLGFRVNRNYLNPYQYDFKSILEIIQVYLGIFVRRFRMAQK